VAGGTWPPRQGAQDITQSCQIE